MSIRTPKVPDDLNIDDVISFEVIDGDVVMTLYGQKLLIVSSEIKYQPPERWGCRDYRYFEPPSDHPSSIRFDLVRYREKPKPVAPPKRTWATTMGLIKPKPAVTMPELPVLW